MADKDYKVFIVEGEVRESQIIDNISKFLHMLVWFFPENLQVLWRIL